MSAISNGKSLSMHNDAIYKGTFTNNGTLLKLHENAYTIGYSALLAPAGTTGGTVAFGNGVFYNATEKNNKVYVGAPTATGASAKFAGIVAREPAIASGYPAINDEVTTFQKGMLVKEGFIVYKNAPVSTTAESTTTIGDPVNLYENATVLIGTNMYIQASDGTAYFGTAKVATADVLAGKVVEINPDDKSVTVHVSPSYYL